VLYVDRGSIQTMLDELKRLEQRQPPRGYREAIIMDDLVATDNLEEDETILGLSEIGWDNPDCKVWMRKKGESLVSSGGALGMTQAA